MVAEIAARFPQDAFLVESLCTFYTTWNREEEALACIRQLQELQAEESVIERLQAHIYRRFQRWHEAVRVYRSQLELPERRTPYLLASLGEALLRLEDPAVEALFDEAQSCAREWGEFLFLADLYERCGRYEQATDMVRRLLSHTSLSATHRVRLEAQWKRLNTLMSAS